jgi:hypothetical protein
MIQLAIISAPCEPHDCRRIREYARTLFKLDGSDVIEVVCFGESPNDIGDSSFMIQQVWSQFNLC